MSEPRGATLLCFEFGSLSELAGGDTFALPVSAVHSVIETDTLTPVPLAPPIVEGIINHNGRIVTVIDPAPLFGLEAQPQPASQVVVLRREVAGHVGLKVVRTRDVVREDGLGPADIPAPALISRMGLWSGRLVHVIDLRAFLDSLHRGFGVAKDAESRRRQHQGAEA